MPKLGAEKKCHTTQWGMLPMAFCLGQTPHGTHTMLHLLWVPPPAAPAQPWASCGVAPPFNWLFALPSLSLGARPLSHLTTAYVRETKIDKRERAIWGAERPERLIMWPSRPKWDWRSVVSKLSLNVAPHAPKKNYKCSVTTNHYFNPSLKNCLTIYI